MKALLASLLLLATPAPGARAASCCAAPAPAAAAEAPLPADSVYQLEGSFEADTGERLALADLKGQPVALAMFFSNCVTACPALLADLAGLHARLSPETARSTRLVLVSFDTERDTPAALAAFREQRGLDKRWTLLRADEATVRELAAVLGVKYRREADGQFAHSNVVSILDASGVVTHRRLGLQGGLDEAAAALEATLRQ